MTAWAAGEVPGAVKVNGAWRIPTSYDRQAWLDQFGTTASTAVPAVGQHVVPVHHEAGALVPTGSLAAADDDVTPRELLTRMPGFLTADEVSTVLGIPVAQVRANSEMFGGLPVGPGGSLRYRHDVVAGYFPRA